MTSKELLVSLITNLSLGIIKVIGGFFTNSKTLISDGIHCLSDMCTDVIGIIGTKLAKKKPDKEHPFGHGKIEYVTSMLMSIFIVILGITCIMNSFKSTNNGSIIRLPYYDYELLLIGKINNNTKSFVSEEVFNILLAESNEIVYNVTLNDWSKLGKAISDINGNFPFEKGHFISVYRYSEDTSNYDTLYYIFRTVIIVIFALGITFIIKDIYTQEKEKSYMYYCLGFTKWQLRALGIIKIGLLFVLGFIAFALVYGVILLL